MQLLVVAGFVVQLLFLASGAAAQSVLAPPPVPDDPPPPAGTVVLQKTLGDFLKPDARPKGPEANNAYALVPAELDQAVRYIAMDNFTSATAELLPRIQSSSAAGLEDTTASLWLGITYALQAYYYPDEGKDLATSATSLLNAVVEKDPHAAEAPDVARLLAEMVSHGWTTNDPEGDLRNAELKAETTRRAVDFYYAGVISRRLSARAWAHSDTAEQDQKTLSLFAKAVARNPNHYESWSAYLPSMLPVGMHDLATTEAAKMYEQFKNLRTPLLADQGPAVLQISNSSYRTMKDDEDLLAEVAERWPDAPMPPFETAMRAIESTPTLAMELFPKLIERFENGDIKPLPREAGYYPSALYKWAFLLQTVDRTREALEVYRKVKALSPDYAEVNLNIGILLAQLSEKEQDPAKKVALLEEALVSVNQQKNYRGKAAEKVTGFSEKIREAIAKVKRGGKQGTR